MQFRERVIDEPGDEEEPEEKDEQIQGNALFLKARLHLQLMLI